MSMYYLYHDVNIPGPLPVWPEQPDNLDLMTARFDCHDEAGWYRTTDEDRIDRVKKRIWRRRILYTFSKRSYPEGSTRPCGIARLPSVSLPDYAWKLITDEDRLKALIPFKKQWRGRKNLLQREVSAVFERTMMADILREMRIAHHIRVRRHNALCLTGQFHRSYSTYMTLNTFRHNTRDWYVRPLRYGHMTPVLKGTSWEELSSDHTELLFAALRYTSLSQALEDATDLKINYSQLKDFVMRNYRIDLTIPQLRAVMARYRWARRKELMQLAHSYLNNIRRRKSRQIRVLRYTGKGFKYSVLSKKPRVTFNW